MTSSERGRGQPEQGIPVGQYLPWCTQVRGGMPFNVRLLLYPSRGASGSLPTNSAQLASLDVKTKGGCTIQKKKKELQNALIKFWSGSGFCLALWSNLLEHDVDALF